MATKRKVRATFKARVNEWRDLDYNRGFSVELEKQLGLGLKKGSRVKVTVELVKR